MCRVLGRRKPERASDPATHVELDLLAQSTYVPPPAFNDSIPPRLPGHPCFQVDVAGASPLPYFASELRPGVAVHDVDLQLVCV